MSSHIPNHYVTQSEWGTDPAAAGLPVRSPSDNFRAPGDGEWAVPHFLTFSQIINFVSRAYRGTHDEALLHSRENARAMRRDPVILDALRARQIPVVLLPWHLEGPRQNDSRQAEAIDKLTDIILHIPRFRSYLMNLLEAEFFGRYACQSRYEWDYSEGYRRLVVADWRPIHGDKLAFRYDGTAGVLVHAHFPGSWELTDRGRVHFFSPEERERVCIHKYEVEDQDFYESAKAGGVHGTGFRDRLYWFWYLRSQVLSFLMDYLERVGAGGLTIYYYRDGDPQSLADVKQAAETQHRNHVLLFPRSDVNPNGGPGIQVIEPSNAGAALLQQLITGYFDDRMAHFILGQSLTSTAQSTGLGSGVAELHGDVFTQRVKYDALLLEDTLTRELVRPLQRYNAPKAPPLWFRFDLDSPNALEILQAAQIFYEMGGAVSENQLREVAGLETPQPGESILAQMGSLQPQLAGQAPEGVPVMGNPGLPPDMAGGGMEGMGGVPPELLAAMSGGGGLPFRRRGSVNRLSRGGGYGNHRRRRRVA